MVSNPQADGSCLDPVDTPPTRKKPKYALDDFYKCLLRAPAASLDENVFAFVRCLEVGPGQARPGQGRLG